MLPSTDTVIEFIGAVFENSATIRTGEVVVLPVGETIVAVCEKVIVDASRNNTGAKLRWHADTKASS
jgi:hypothetical protein